MKGLLLTYPTNYINVNYTATYNLKKKEEDKLGLEKPTGLSLE